MLANKRKLYVISAFISLISTLNVAGQETLPPTELCCDFESDTCDIINLDWKWSTQYSPTPYSIPYYSGNYMWTNTLHSQLITTTIRVTPLTVYSFDFYMSDYYNYFYVKFRRASDGTVISLFDTAYDYGYWYNAVIDFSKYGSQSCGGLTCEGEIMIVIDGSDTSFVAGIDNFGLADICGGHLSTVITLPPPVYHACCIFESDICDYTLFNWKWSAESKPTYSVPNQSGNYIWTSTLDSQIISGPQYSVNYTTHFQFSYYLDSSSNYVYLYFREATSGEVKQLTYFSYTSSAWRSEDVKCYSDCCSSYPCDGELIISVTGSDSSFVAAIDSIGRDHSCEEDLPCCFFDDDTLCNFNTTDSDENFWKYSDDYYPYYPPPSPGSNYVFFETVNYNESEILEVILESPTITINYNSIFTGNIYARDDSQNNEDTSLFVYFYNEKAEESILLDFVKDTSGSWKDIAFYCESTHGNCCPDNQCTGKIQIAAKVGSDGGSVFYGIDAFEIDNACSNFPGPSPSY